LDFEYDEGDEVEVEFVPAPVVQKKEVICVDETSDVSENDIYTGEDLDEPFEEAEEVVEEQAEVEEEAKVEEETEVEVEEVEEDVEEDVDVEEEAEEEAEEEEVVEEVEQEEVEEQVVEEEVEASDGEAELEVEEFEVDGVVYYTTSTINGIIYNKNNEEVGKIVNGEAEFYEVEEEPATEEAEPAAEEEEDAAEEDGAVEVEEVEINGITYYTTSTTDGMIYNQDDEEVGQYVKGKPKFFKRK
jgi:hypothetical protein